MSDLIAAPVARRAFVVGSAGAAVAPTALAAMNQQDPIFAAIGAHRAATAGVYATIEAHTSLEMELPREKKKSIVSVCGEEIVATDDPRWVDCQRAVLRAWEAQDDAAVALLNIRPTTMAGVTALLRYAVEADGVGWPDELVTAEGDHRSWHQLLVEKVAAALPNCA